MSSNSCKDSEDKNSGFNLASAILRATMISIAALGGGAKVFQTKCEKEEYSAKKGLVGGFINETKDVYNSVYCKDKENISNKIKVMKEELRDLELKLNSKKHFRKGERTFLEKRISGYSESIQYLEQLENNWSDIIACDEEFKNNEKQLNKLFITSKKKKTIEEKKEECLKRKEETLDNIKKLEAAFESIEEKNNAVLLEHIEKIKPVILIKRIMCTLFILLLVCGLCYLVYRFGIIALLSKFHT